MTMTIMMTVCDNGRFEEEGYVDGDAVKRSDSLGHATEE